jgi:hypothetical protein
MVLFSGLDDETMCLEGASVRAATEEVAAATITRYNRDLSRYAALKHTTSLLAFHSRGFSLRVWGRIQHLGFRDFCDPTPFKVQDLGSGKINTALGVSAEYAQMGSIADVAYAFRNVAAALSLGFDNSELIYVESLRTAADSLEQQDSSVGGHLPVSTIALALEGDLQEWISAIKRGVASPFQQSEETTMMIQRHVDHGLTKLEANPSLRFATSNKRGLPPQTAPDKAPDNDNSKKKNKRARQAERERAKQNASSEGQQNLLCYVCGATDHIITSCPKKILRQHQDGLTCWRCGGNHRMTACPVPRGQDPGQAVGAASASK